MKFYFNIEGKKHTEELANYGEAFRRLNEIQKEKGLDYYAKCSVESKNVK